MGTSGAFIAVCITALAEGGPAMLATLVALSSLGQFSISVNLSFLRRILTPTVAGTVIMLIPVTVMPIIFDMLADTPIWILSVKRPGPDCPQAADRGSISVSGPHSGRCFPLSGSLP